MYIKFNYIYAGKVQACYFAVYETSGQIKIHTFIYVINTANFVYQELGNNIFFFAIHR